MLWRSVRRLVLFDRCYAFANHLLDLLRQRSVTQRSCLTLAVIEHPVHEPNQGLGLGSIAGVGGDQQPGKAGDRVGVRTGGIRNRDAVVRRHVLGGGGGGGGNTVRACLRNLPDEFFTEPKDILFCSA